MDLVLSLPWSYLFIKQNRLLATIPFDSARKRMSVLVQTPEGHYRLYCKGADNVMFDRASDYSLCGGRVLLEEHLEVFSNEGLRTLVLAYMDLEASAAEDWAAKWNHALTLPDRADACEVRIEYDRMRRRTERLKKII